MPVGQARNLGNVKIFDHDYKRYDDSLKFEEKTGVSQGPAVTPRYRLGSHRISIIIKPER